MPMAVHLLRACRRLNHCFHLPGGELELAVENIKIKGRTEKRKKEKEKERGRGRKALF
jgi:hypothetical protein